MTSYQLCPTKLNNEFDKLEQKNDQSHTPSFHTFTKINGRHCKVIIDRDIRLNAISSTTIESLDLTTFNHPLPYMISWNNNITYEVKHKCLVPIDFNLYQAHIWCDVIPLKIGHILLGTP